MYPTHRLNCSSSLWFIFRILQGSSRKELLWSLWGWPYKALSVPLNPKRLLYLKNTSDNNDTSEERASARPLNQATAVRDTFARPGLLGFLSKKRASMITYTFLGGLPNIIIVEWAPEP